MDNVCAICLVNVKRLTALPCGHIYHKKCIRQWKKRECPTCRSPHNWKINKINEEDIKADRDAQNEENLLAAQAIANEDYIYDHYNDHFNEYVLLLQLFEFGLI